MRARRSRSRRTRRRTAALVIPTRFRLLWSDANDLDPAAVGRLRARPRRDERERRAAGAERGLGGRQGHLHRPRHRHARRPQVRARLHALRLREPGRARRAAQLRQAAVGTFDSFNPFIIKGNPAAGIGLIYDTLMTASADEPFSEYGLLAETVETPADRSWVTFTLRPEARWHDGKPITRRRRDLDLRDAAHQGPAVLPRLLRQRRQGREDRRAHASSSPSSRARTASCR